MNPHPSMEPTYFKANTVIEVGLGGRIDATNVTPIVCGITPLGYDHTEILGNTLEAIAGQKAGIFKKGVPAFTVSQPHEALQVLKDKASQLDVSSNSITAKSLHCIAGRFYNIIQITLLHVRLQVASQLDGNLLNGLHLGLAGEINIPSDLVYYMDGAHSPESMEVCANWFSLAIKEDDRQRCSSNHKLDDSRPSNDSRKDSEQRTCPARFKGHREGDMVQESVNVQEGGVVAQESVDVQKEGIVGQESVDIQEEGGVAPESVDVQEEGVVAQESVEVQEEGESSSEDDEELV
ncbi:folylpolyglutamate synthase-like protein isoform X2 [Tanacetum coccineum]|uniref:Folylpolyglutamate synthase-like protein isoform X2 n=1 Tax=Tanacetum coccineum TaxID=301880 RepID=A0ABQ5ARK4_9ASTR